jgi:hypothetical protein
LQARAVKLKGKFAEPEDAPKDARTASAHSRPDVHGRCYAPQAEAFSPEREVLMADHTRADTMEEIAAQILADAPQRFALAGCRWASTWRWRSSRRHLSG